MSAVHLHHFICIDLRKEKHLREKIMSFIFLSASYDRSATNMHSTCSYIYFSVLDVVRKIFLSTLLLFDALFNSIASYLSGT